MAEPEEMYLMTEGEILELTAKQYKELCEERGEHITLKEARQILKREKVTAEVV